MNRADQLKFCKLCTKRKFNPEKGLICTITKEIANFEETCINFEKDISIKITEESKKKIIINDKPIHLFYLSTIILISGIISYYIQENGFLYKGDSLGNIAIFIFSFFLISSLAYKFLMPVKLSFLHAKSIFGILTLVSSLTIFFFSIAIIIDDRYISWGIFLFLFTCYNFIYLVSTKFWNKKYQGRNYKVFAVINVALVTILLIGIINLVMRDMGRVDNEDRLIIIVILAAALVNYLYSLILFRKK